MGTCVDLRQLSGGRYRLGWDPAYDPRKVPRDKRDPWMMTIPCRDGCVIFPFGGGTLAVECGRRRRRALRKLGLKVHQDGDDGATFLFDAADFERVAEVAGARRRRRYGPEQLARLRAQAAKARAAIR